MVGSLAFAGRCHAGLGVLAMAGNFGSHCGVFLVAALAAACGGADEQEGSASASAACAEDRACVSTIAGGIDLTEGSDAAAARLRFPYAVAVDRHGRIQVADYGAGNNVITVLPNDMLVEEPGELASFPYPGDVAVDAQGNRYEADRYNNRIVRIAVDGSKQVIAGRGGSVGGDVDGDASVARFSLPAGLVLDGQGDLLVADLGNAKVRKIRLPKS